MYQTRLGIFVATLYFLCGSIVLNLVYLRWKNVSLN